MTLHISFKKKVIFAIASIVLIFGALAAASVFGVTQRMITLFASKYLESITAQQKHLVEMVVDESFASAKDIAGRHQIISYLEQKDPQIQDPALLAYLAEMDPENRYDSINIMDSSGTDLVSTNAAAVNQNFKFRDYFKKGIAGTPTLEPAISVVTKTFGYYFSYPVKNTEGQIIGVVVLKVKSGLFNEAIQPKALDPDTSAAMLIDENGVAVQATHPELLYKSVGDLTTEAQAAIASTRKFEDITILPLQYDPPLNSWKGLSEIKVFTVFDAQYQRNEVVAIAPISGTGLSIVLEEAVQSFSATAGSIAGIISLFVVATMIVAALTLFFLLSQLLKPLELLKRTALQVSQGDLKNPVSIKTGDEFEDLGAAFNAMLRKLNDVYEHLEEKVWQRTADFEKFRLAVEAASDPVIITDIDGRVLYANKAAEHTTGYPRSEMIGNKPSLWGRQMPDEYYAQLWKTIKTEKREFNGEILNKRKSGEKYTAELHIAPLLTQNGALYGFVSIERDITARKEVDRARTEFVSIASHQLRTPLAVINWYIEMLTKGEVGKVNKDQKKYLEQIQVASRRMVDLVNSLLSVSRIDMGAFTAEPETLVLTEIADAVLAEIDPQIKERHLTILKKYAHGMKTIKADPSMLRIIFQNLIGNAVTYTPSDGTITITIELTEQEDASIIVADTGYGIPKAQQKRIFEKFFRADNAREKAPNGNGLGLYIVKAIIDQMHGTIRFFSEEGKGTAFIVTLPSTDVRRETNEQT